MRYIYVYICIYIYTYTYRIKFRMSEVRENEIALRKLFVGIAQLRTLEGTLLATLFGLFQHIPQ